MINPILPFRAFLGDSKKSKVITPKDGFEASSEVAVTALKCGALSDEDAQTVRKAQASAASETKAPEKAKKGAAG